MQINTIGLRLPIAEVETCSIPLRVKKYCNMGKIRFKIYEPDFFPFSKYHGHQET